MSVPKVKYAIGNAASTTLASGVTNTDTTAALTATTNFQAKTGEGMTLFDEGLATEELAYSTGLSGSSLSIPLANRGLEGGSAQAHSASGDVKGVMTAGMWNDHADAMLNILDQTTGDIDHAEVTALLYAADSGSNDTYAITLSPVPASLAAITGLPLTFKANTANTGAATLNVNSLGAKTIKKQHDQDLSDNDIESGQTVTVVYDGTNFQMQSQLANSSAASTVGTDGWTDDSAHTWTYASASTFTVAGVDLTAVFTKGTRLKFTQTTVKYAVVVSSSFSTNTTVTIAVNTDYVIANAAITLPFYSYQSNPAGYPGYFAFTVAVGGFSADPASMVGRFAVNGRTCHLLVFMPNNGTSNASSFTITAPIPALNNGIDTPLHGQQAVDSGTIQAAPMVILTNNSSTITAYKDQSATTWTGSGNKRLNYLSGTYPI